MKIKKVTDIDERFNNLNDIVKHYEEHVTDDGGPGPNGFPTDVNFVKGHDFDEPPEGYAQYNKEADLFARQRAVGITSDNSSDVVGFIQNEGPKQRICKYRKSTGEFTAYKVENGEPINMSYFFMKPDRWEREKKNPRGCNPIPKELEDAICRN